MSELVVLSPHLDDAVLSCGGRIAHDVAAGRTVTVVTLFTADEPAEPPSRLARDLRRWWKLPHGVMAARRSEDLAACAALGARAEHWDLPEAPYRLDPAGSPLYDTLSVLFGEVSHLDDRFVEALAARLAPLAGRGEILTPLGVGGHVDHRVVRRAAERAGVAALYYEEFPYTEWKWFALRRALGRPDDWRAEPLALSADEVEARVGAIARYRSQVPVMFRNEGRLRRQVRRAVRRSGGERLWRKAGGAPR